MRGSLQTKNGRYHMVITYRDDSGKRKNKWISTEQIGTSTEQVRSGRKGPFLGLVWKY